MIADYLRRLDRELPGDPLWRRRVLVETEDHLLAAARRERDAGAAPADAERLAVEAFGPPETLVAGLRQGLQVRVLRQSGAALILLLAAALPVFYGIPENTLPPAPWPGDSPPADLRWKRDAVWVAHGAAFLGAVAALVAAWRGWAAAALAAMSAALAALVVEVVVGVVVALEWPVSPPLLAVLALAASVGGTLAAAALAVARAARYSRSAR